jgi:hypothetical protein
LGWRWKVFTGSVARVDFVDKPRMQALGQTGLPSIHPSVILFVVMDGAGAGVQRVVLSGAAT